MPQETMVYDSQIAGLEGKVSYGTLGILNCLMIHLNDSPNIKKQCMLINGGTIVRNAYFPQKNAEQFVDPLRRAQHEKEILDQVALDFFHLRHCFEMYVSGSSSALVYFQPDVNHLIPEAFRKKETEGRILIDKLTKTVSQGENLRNNIVTKLDESNKVTYYGLQVAGIFAYRSLSKTIKSSELKQPSKIYLVSHCPIDYLLMSEYPQVELILSHTGKILQNKDLGVKVFKEDRIPFNRMTLKLFGDKDFIKAACRNKPKALKILENINLKLKTEREIAALAKDKLGIDPKDFSWNL